MTKSIVHGEYPIGDENARAKSVRANARWKFVQAISRVCPEVFETLFVEVYPKYCELSNKDAERWRYGWSFEHWQQLSDDNGRLSEDNGRLGLYLKEWSHQFGIDESWARGRSNKCVKRKRRCTLSVNY